MVEWWANKRRLADGLFCSKEGIELKTPIRIAVCEDTQEDADLLLRYISESGVAAECRVLSSGKALAADYVPGQYDLVFLDIYVDDVQQGIDAAAKIRENDCMVTLAFTTVSQEHALEGYRLKAFSYLEKPVNCADVQEVLEYAASRRETAPAIQLLIGGKNRNVPLESILYFEYKKHAVFVNTLTRILRTSQKIKLKDIEPLLPTWFFRCHQSYIANLRYVKELDQELRIFRMQNGDAVYIRRPSLNKAIKAYERHLFAMARNNPHEDTQ